MAQQEQQHAVVLYPDASLERKVRGVWAGLADAGVRSLLPGLQVRPHVSLTCYEELDVPRFREELERFVRKRPVLPVSFSHVGVFPKGVVFLGLTCTEALLTFHREFHACLRGFWEASFDLYLPGSWVPHCTLGIELRPEEIAPAVDVARTIKLPVEARLERVALLQYPPTQERAVFNLEEE